MNKQYEVLVWDKILSDSRLGHTDNVTTFSNYKKADDFYHKVLDYKVKIFMKYESDEPDSDGEVLEESWK